MELRGISKRFPNGVLACDRIDIQIYKGQVLALLGENGAGKSTLMNIVSGLTQPSGGDILVDGQRVNLANGRDALALGISMVHQHFALVPPMTVGQNVTLGREPGRWLVSQREVNARVNDLSKRFKLALNAKAKVRDLPVGMQQRVEIVKALYYDARVLVLDEPTAVLTPQESDYLFEVVRQLTASGRAIVFISHKLPEVKAIADRVVVLRAGQVIGEVDPSTSEAEFARMMVGRSVQLRTTPSSRTASDLEVLRLDRVSTTGHPGLRDVSLSVSAGEILGVAGVDGNGQLELEETIAGQRQPTSGNVKIAGKSWSRPRRGQLRDVVGRDPVGPYSLRAGRDCLNCGKPAPGRLRQAPILPVGRGPGRGGQALGPGTDHGVRRESSRVRPVGRYSVRWQPAETGDRPRGLSEYPHPGGGATYAWA